MPILSLVISENEEVPVVHNMKFIKCFCSNTAYSYNLCSDNTMSNVSVLTADLKYTVELLNEYRIVRRRNHSYHQGVYMYLSVLGTNMIPKQAPARNTGYLILDSQFNPDSTAAHSASADWPGNTKAGGSTSDAFSSHCGALAVVAIWRENQWWQGLSLSASPFPF